MTLENQPAVIDFNRTQYIQAVGEGVANIMPVTTGTSFQVIPRVIEARVASDIPLLPGISNASGIMEGYGLGYRRFKLFPAEVSGGVAAIKALGGPFGEVKFCPTGGVSPANIRSYMALKNVMCVGGSWMLDSEWIKNGDWARIQECTAEALALRELAQG